MFTAQNSILPSRPFTKPNRRATGTFERPKSQVFESSTYSSRTSTPASPRHPPRGASASSMKKWGSTEGLFIEFSQAI